MGLHALRCCRPCLPLTPSRPALCCTQASKSNLTAYLSKTLRGELRTFRRGTASYAELTPAARGGGYKPAVCACDLARCRWGLDCRNIHLS